MPSDPVELTRQIKASCDIADVVGGYLTLVPAGPIFKAICPFHTDSRPSLDVDSRRQRYKCWSCGAHGDVFSFVEHMEKVGFRVHTDVRNGPFRWLTVQHPEQPSLQLGLFVPGPPVLDEATAREVKAIVAKGAMPPLVLEVDDCRAAYARMRAAGVEFTQPPTERYGNVDANFRDPSGNGWRMMQARRRT